MCKREDGRWQMEKTEWRMGELKCLEKDLAIV
jgi:hypothetical protein